jgi:hypothetical protein
MNGANPTQAATATELCGISMTAAEVASLSQALSAGYFAIGDRLWRVPMPHFTPWDANMGFFPPEDADAPEPLFETDEPNEKPYCEEGSILELQNRALGETVDLPGTPFFLAYRSDRTKGYKAYHRIKLRLSKKPIPASARALSFRVSAGGRTLTQHTIECPGSCNNLTMGNLPGGAAIESGVLVMDWDGVGALTADRLQGPQAIHARIGLRYDGAYQTNAVFATSAGIGATASFTNGRPNIWMWKEVRGRAGNFDASALGLGGWTLSPHHVYDPTSRLLLRGDGTTERFEPRTLGTASVLAGVPWSCVTSSTGTCGAGPPPGATILPNCSGLACFTPTPLATEAELRTPSAVAYGPDGTLFIAERVAYVGQTARPILRKLD